MRIGDLIWLLLFAGMAVTSPSHEAPEMEILAALCLLQLAEPRVAFFRSPRGRLASFFLKLVLGYLLIGLTNAIASSFWPILLLPVVAASTTLGLWGTALAIIAAASYLSFILFLKPDQYITTEFGLELGLRVLFLVVIAYLTHELAAQIRTEAQRYQQAARQLETANKELREAELAVRRSDRLAALGQLTAGLAHELRNPLGTIRASAEMLSKQSGASSEVAQELAGYITSEVDRCNSLVTRFLDFARPLSIRSQTIELTPVLDRAVGELQRRQPPLEVTVYKNYSPDIPAIQGDAELLESVFYNLLLNAAQATSAGGAVTIKTRRTSGGGVEVAVIDRGSGIKPEHRESIFNPFFTTKTDGVGLGLAIVAKIIDEHGGTISVESEPGKGSVFRVVLPG